MHLYVARLAVKSIVLEGSETIKGGPGLEAFMKKEEKSFILETYKVDFKGLLLQDPGSGELILLKRGEKIMLRDAGEEYFCRWHTGPLDSRDDPLTRKYCLRRASGGLGYCSEHLGSLRAVYDTCFGSSGMQSREACIRLDRAVKGRVEYAVYIVDYGGRKLKVGSTRLFRWLDRIAEQPHVTAALIHVSRSAVDARSTEKAVASIKGFAEIPARNRLMISRHTLMLESARRIASAAEMLASKGYSWSRIVVRIKPPEEFEEAVSATLRELEGRTLELQGYWGGHVILAEGSKHYALPLRSLLHRESVAVPA